MPNLGPGELLAIAIGVLGSAAAITAIATVIYLTMRGEGRHHR